MARLIGDVGIYRIYELSRQECAAHGREYPTLVCWLSSHDDEIGDMRRTENETDTFKDMLNWCRRYS